MLILNSISYLYFKPIAGLPVVSPQPPSVLNLSKAEDDQITKKSKPFEVNIDGIKTLPQQEIPVPKTKMKTINWNKIPSNKVVGKTNLWSILADSHQGSPKVDLNWDEMEGLFCLQPTQNSPKLGREKAPEISEKKLKRENEINLLDGKRSLNVNIFLKQFRR